MKMTRVMRGWAKGVFGGVCEHDKGQVLEILVEGDTVKPGLHGK